MKFRPTDEEIDAYIAADPKRADMHRGEARHLIIAKRQRRAVKIIRDHAAKGNIGAAIVAACDFTLANMDMDS